MENVVVDIDGHVAEPITLIMNEYLDPEFKDRPIRLLNDEHDLEYVEINGKKSKLLQRGTGIGLDGGIVSGVSGKELVPFLPLEECLIMRA